MTNYLAAIDLVDEDSWEKVFKKTGDSATGIDYAKIYLMTVISGVTAGLDQRYAIRDDMHRSTEYPMQEWKDRATAELREIADNYIPKEMQAGVVVENGTVYREIVEAAKDLDINQIRWVRIGIRWQISCLVRTRQEWRGRPSVPVPWCGSVIAMRLRDLNETAVTDAECCVDCSRRYSYLKH